MSYDDDLLSVHKTRFMARLRERRLQRALDDYHRGAGPVPQGVPSWAKGVKVVKAGGFQWVVRATAIRGH